MEHAGPSAAWRLEPLEPLKTLFEAKDWKALRRVLNGCPVWAFDRPVRAGALVDALEERLGGAERLQLLVLAVKERERPGGEEAVTCRCCAMWDEPDSWDPNESELDLHVAFRKGRETERRALYLGITGGAGHRWFENCRDRDNKP